MIAFVVDGYSSGRWYPPVFRNLGYDCVHLQSTKLPIKLGTLDKSNYIDEIVHEGDINKTIGQIQRRYPNRVACVAGSEIGVSFADQVSEMLGLRTNGSKKSNARRNKYEMVEVLRAHGIKTLEHFKSDNLDDIISWLKKHNKWPVVLKPLSSAGTDNVFICQDLDEVKSAYQAIKGNINIFDQENHEVLVQSYLQGQEYVVNSINCVHPTTGKPYHFLNDIWMCKKQEFFGHRIYDYELLLSFDGELQRSLVSYINRVLNALEIYYGPSHAEVMITEEGPVLVEVASRFSGGTNPDMSNMCVGYNPVDLAARSFVDPSSFFNIIAKHENSSLEKTMNSESDESEAVARTLASRSVKKYAAVMDLAVNLEGEVKEIPLKKMLEDAKLQSVFSVKYKVAPGQKITRTISLPTSPVQFHLIHENQQMVIDECAEIKGMSDKAFVVSPVENKGSKKKNLEKISDLFITNRASKTASQAEPKEAEVVSQPKP